MNLLLTNDDGFDAPGLSALFASVTQRLGTSVKVIVVAPDRCRSECGHSVTTGRPLLVRETQPGWFSVDGTPVDCVRAAKSTIFPQLDAVISGINAGANLGVDLLVSGTFAAAREAAIQGIPALAVSHYRRPDVPRTWDHVGGWLDEVLDDFINESGKGTHTTEPILWNLNLPAIDPSGPKPSRIECSVDLNPMVRTAVFGMEESNGAKSLSMQSEFHGRPRSRGSDVDHCFSGRMTLSRIKPQII